MLRFLEISRRESSNPEKAPDLINTVQVTGRNSTARSLLCVGALALVALTSQGCASIAPPRSFEFFVEATPENQPWYDKIQDWRARSNADPNSPVGLPATVLSGELAELDPTPPLWPRLNQFHREHQLELVRKISAWSQHWAFRHYIKDTDESVENDPWPTFSELLEQDGDDCDGLSLLNYEMLLLFGFDRDKPRLAQSWHPKQDIHSSWSSPLGYNKMRHLSR